MTKSFVGIEVSEVTSRVTITHHQEFYKLNAAAVALDNFIVVSTNQRWIGKLKRHWNSRTYSIRI